MSDSSGGGGSSSLSPLRLLISLSVPLVVVALSWKLELRLETKLLIAITRSALQLFLAGYVLLGFIFASKSPALILLYLFMMLAVAAVELTCRQVRTYKNHFQDSLLCICVSGGMLGIVGAIVVFDPTPWYEPSIFVPTVGMLIGNSISGPALAVDRLLSEIMDKRHEPEVRLAFGARSFEAVLPVIRAALSAALMPLINQMSVVGLVSIPGMMSGQLLGGSLPLVAAEYQMAILWLICGVTAVSTYAGTQLALNHAVFDNSHRLTPARIFKRQDGKVELEVALFRALLSLPQQLLVAATVLSAWASKQIASADGDATSTRTDANAVAGSGSGSGSGGAAYEIVPAAAADGIDKSTHSMLHPPSEDVELAVSTHRMEKATFVVHDQTPEAYLDLEKLKPIPDESYFNVEALNVISGEIPLFPVGGWSFRLLKGQRLVISGPSGIGKTRLLRAISHLDEPLPEVSMNLSDTVFPETSIPSWRCRVMYVPQSIPPCAGTPIDLLREALGYSSRNGFPKARELMEGYEGECHKMEDSLGLEKGKLSSLWTSLSGGERQRCCIAIALLLGGTVPDGAVVLMDEPTAACDFETMIKVEKAIISSGLTVIMITHDEGQAERIAHKRIFIQPHPTST